MQGNLHDQYYETPFSYRVQKTLNAPLTFSGVGLHSGAQVELRINPAPENHGIVLRRTDSAKAPAVLAHFDSVVDTRMCTTLGVQDQKESWIATVEHLIGALFAMGITNVDIEVDGPEIPILDGSALPFVEAIYDCGVDIQPFSTPTLKIHKPIRMEQGESICQLLPRDRLRATSSIDFPHPAIGLQTFALELTPKSFREDLCSARTFGFQKDLDGLRSRNLALGASVDNVLAFDNKGILNSDGARFFDECVRHKILDAIGDLALCGCWIEGELVSFRGGHSIHLALLQTLKDFRGHWERLPAGPLRIPTLLDQDRPAAPPA